MKSKIDQISTSVEEIQNTQKGSKIAFRVTCATNFPKTYTVYKSENPGMNGTFYLFLGKSFHRINKNSVIWKNVEYNFGNAFNASNGKFTCPYDGIYSFYVTSPTYYQHSGEIEIHVNGSRKVYHLNRNQDSNEFHHNSVQGSFKLNQGDTVHIIMYGYFHYAGSECYRTYYEGHLIDLL